MIKIKAIGVRKDRSWIIPIFLIPTVSIIVAATLFWLFYDNEFDYKYLLENGVEVEATVISYDYHTEGSIDGDSDYNSGWYYIWECHYGGRTYSGTSGRAYYRTEEQVLKYLGKKITVTVDPNSNWAVDKPLSEIHTDGFHFKEYLSCAIIFTCLSPFVLTIFIGLVVYPLILNDKIDKSGKLPQQGEVIKIHGFIFNYVKVEYKDKSGAIKQKWSYSWFTKRESKYLSEKKYITIVPYKNTYGILEEMQVKSKK